MSILDEKKVAGFEKSPAKPKARKSKAAQEVKAPQIETPTRQTPDPAALEEFAQLQADEIMRQVPGVFLNEAVQITRAALAANVADGSFHEAFAASPLHSSLADARQLVEARTPPPEPVNNGKSIWQAAERERFEMMEPFMVWAVERERECRHDVRNESRHLRECEPFARAACEDATSDYAPPVILEYARCALDLAENQRLLKLCERAVESLECCDVMLRICDKPAVEVLWKEWREELRREWEAEPEAREEVAR